MQIWDFVQIHENLELLGVHLHRQHSQILHHWFTYFEILQKNKVIQMGFRLFHNIFLFNF